MNNLLTAALLGLSVALTGLTASAAPAAGQAAHGWKLAGAYRSYAAACRKADQLEASGYDACIKMQSGYYCVYCR